MAIRLKTAEQIEKMRRAGRIVRQVLKALGERVAPGVTTKELDDQAERIMRQAGAEGLFKGVPGKDGAGPFPGYICASINDEVVHGIPSTRAIRSGDIVSIDFGVRLDGWCADAAETFVVGPVPPDVQRLVDVTRNTLAMAREMVRPGRRWSDVAAVMQQYVEDEGFSVVQEFVGHGIGEAMWEDPKVPNFVSGDLRRRDIDLVEGLVLAVEPMVNLGRRTVQYARDGWTVVTRDGKPSAHFEDTLAVTATGCRVLTAE
ncbi:MAG: type I methionyl aminopeptidase [Planctomycetaceae bacterium]|nr:type I methionyl aminopeptidase [Planctomycetaceae bacterium]